MLHRSRVLANLEDNIDFQLQKMEQCSLSTQTFECSSYTVCLGVGKVLIKFLAEGGVVFNELSPLRMSRPRLFP